MNHCDKDGTAVLKRVASYHNQSSSTLILGDGHKPQINEYYIEECSHKIFKLYNMEKAKTVVLGSCHQAAVYIA